MKHYKKRTIALCLASVLTVVGAFGAENYSNRLMSVGINNVNNKISITAYTEKQLDKEIKAVQQSNNVYTIILPQTDSTAKTPNIENCPNIESVEISTFPYTYEQQGYTKVTVKTVGYPLIEANSTLFITDLKNNNYETEKAKLAKRSYWDAHEAEEVSQSPVPDRTVNKYQENNKVKSQTVSEPLNSKTEDSKTNTNIVNNTQNQQTTYNSTLNEPTVAVIAISLLCLIIGFIFLIGKDKMASVVGEQNKIDLSDDDTKKNDSKTHIRKTINSLDKKYLNSSVSYTSEKNDSNEIKHENVNNNVDEEEEEVTIVNLDELYKEKTQSTENTSDAGNNIQTEEVDDLADFLSEFSFNDEEKVEEVAEETQELFDENLYQDVINNSNLKFTNDDIAKLNQLLRLEISSETQNTLDEYIKAELAKPKPLTQQQILENLVTTYSIKQNISFTNDDIKALKSIMSVELDKDFITDLRIKPGRAKEAETEIKNTKINKTSKTEIINLKVKDLLPDLSKELKKQGNKRIESEVKPQVVYYSEGYEYTKLAVPDDLSNISAALKSKDATEHKESYFSPIVENGYEVSTLAIKDELPDLEDVKANPEKYKEKPVIKEKADESVLLKNIANVSFKPFYEELQEVDGTENDKSDDISNLKQEFVNIENTEKTHVDVLPSEKNIEKSSDVIYTKINNDAQNLLKLIEEQKIARQNKKQEEIALFKKELEKASSKNEHKEEIQQLKSNIKPENNDNYEIIKTILINKDTECSLVKTNDGYEVIGCIKDKQFNLKHYNTLKTINLQLRAHEKDKQYLVKLGIHKFVINITENNMEFVMDLC